jgi:hypothetical protein
MLPFWASRCFRREFRRVILALAARTASALVGCCFGCGVFAAFPAVGIIGSPCVGIEPRSRGCIVIGPVDVGLLLGILNTARGSVTALWGRERPTACTDKRSAIKQRWLQTNPGFPAPGYCLISPKLNPTMS